MTTISLLDDLPRPAPQSGSPRLEWTPAPHDPGALLDETLTVLSFGGGQDSTALLYRYVRDPAFRAAYAPGRLLVIMSATGNEHPDTDRHVRDVAALCSEWGIDFVHLTGDMGYHTGNWKGGLAAQWSATNTIGSASYPKSCTDSLKIAPLWKFVEWWIGREYGFPSGNGKKAIKAYAQRHGKVRCIIGIAKGEESRVAVGPEQTEFGLVGLVEPGGKSGKKKKKKKSGPPKWFLDCVQRIYPLIELGMDRAACQAYIRSLGMRVPPPSNCIMCPYKSHQEVLWTYRFLPDDFAEWLRLEQAKIDAWAGRVDEATGEPLPNHGVKGATRLAEFLAEAQRRYGHWTDAELHGYRMSHGHCVASKY